MNASARHRWDGETMLAAWLATCVSIVCFLFYYHRGEILLYGDAVAHINTARRVFDSRTPGLLQLGTVWLPLPHLLMIPFLLSDALWKSGAGGSFPSLAAYVLSVVGIFRLVRGGLSTSAQPGVEARTAAWLAALIYAANPNLLYLQTTAMTEPVYLVLFIWAIVYFSEFVQSAASSERKSPASKSLIKCGLCLFAACLTRYDGWFLAGALLVGMMAFLLWGECDPRALSRSFAKVVLLVVAAPTLWLGYNAIIYRNPLEFANGPYSAKAIELKISTPGPPPHPGSHDLPRALGYFVMSGTLNMAEGNWQMFWILLGLAGTVAVLLLDRRRWPFLLLWVPLPFYMLSIAYGSVPIFLPVRGSFSLYNVRYGLELLPGFAVCTAVAAYFAMCRVQSAKAKVGLVTAIVVLVVLSYGLIWRAQPICFQEAWVNSRSRLALEAALTAEFKKLPPGSTLLMT
jgi:hypothetical protein